jgi:tRNA(Ile)-lysidine synthase TilS/MesJ
MLFVDTALSMHTACFICRDKTRPLREVKKKDIIHAYTNHKIFIKHHARCCDAHYDENGFIRKEEFDVIPTRKQIYDQQMIKMFDILRPTSENIFEQFQKPDSIEENLCKKFTGLTKMQF